MVLRLHGLCHGYIAYSNNIVPKKGIYMNNKKKRFIFPENIDSKYSVFLGLSLREILIYVVPAVIVGLVFIAFPPHSFTAIIIKVFISIIVITMVIGIISSNPIKDRPNVRLIPYMKLKRQYSKRQNLYFKKAKHYK